METAKKTLGENQKIIEDEFTVYRFRMAKQTITVSDKIFNKTYGDNAFAIGASARTTLDYKSSDDSVASVDGNGNVKINSAGSAVITVTAANENGYSEATDKVTINIDKANDIITTSASKYNITYGEGKGETPFSLSADAKTDLKYKSSNKTVVAVTSNGVVTIKNPGKASITVSSSGNKNYRSSSKTITVNVKLKKPGITLKAIGKKKARITLNNKTPGASGYEVWTLNPGKSKYTKLGTASSKAKTLDFIGTKGKRYKCKIRAYKTVEKKKVYSEFSSVKTVKIK